MTAFPPAWGYFVLVITSGLLFKAALTDLREYKIRNEMIDPFYDQTEVLAPDDIADGIAYVVTRPATPPSASCGSRPPNRYDHTRGPGAAITARSAQSGCGWTN